MQIHGLITLVSGIVLHETRSTAFDLDTASSLLLNVFDIGAALAYDLGTKVKTRNWLEIHRDLLLWPFALCVVLETSRECWAQTNTYTTHGISLDLFWLSATETSLIYEIG